MCASGHRVVLEEGASYIQNLNTGQVIWLSEENGNKDSESIRDQFKKYTELLKYEDNKLKVSDKAKSLVESYKTLP